MAGGCHVGSNRGVSHSTITGPCRDCDEAERWADQLVRAGITPVRIDGNLFEQGGPMMVNTPFDLPYRCGAKDQSGLRRMPGCRTWARGYSASEDAGDASLVRRRLRSQTKRMTVAKAPRARRPADASISGTDIARGGPPA